MALTPLALVVLELLQERPRHPYDIQQTIRIRGLDRFVKVRAGSFYHLVERLHREGLIEQVETGRSGRRPERTIYTITADGREQYLDQVRELVRHPAEEYPVFGVAIEMLRTLDPENAVALLEDRMIEVKATIAHVDQAMSCLIERGHPRIHLVELEYLLAMRRAELRWIRALVDDIRSGVLTWRPRGASAVAAPETGLDNPAGTT
jgi:DNA-binding PadR family transcriptional regulator